MWNFSLEDYRPLSMNAREIFMKACIFPPKSATYGRCEESFRFAGCSIFVLSLLQWRKPLLLLLCLWGLWREWSAWTLQHQPVMAQIWQHCWSCATDGRNLELVCRASASWCLRKSLRLTLVTMWTWSLPLSRCRQKIMVKVKWSRVVFFFFLTIFHAFWYSLCICCRHENKEVELFAWGLQETQWVTVACFCAPVCLLH